jgi:CHRD domain
MSPRLFPGLPLAALVLIGAGPVTPSPVPAKTEQFTAQLSGASETPAVKTAATGTVTLTVDETAQTIGYTVTVSKISDVTGAHIHLGKAGASGPPAVSLLSKPVTGPVNGSLATGIVTAKDLMGGRTFADVVAQIRTGDAYVNVHTKAHPAGEIRGQLTRKMM